MRKIMIMILMVLCMVGVGTAKIWTNVGGDYAHTYRSSAVGDVIHENYTLYSQVIHYYGKDTYSDSYAFRSQEVMVGDVSDQNEGFEVVVQMQRSSDPTRYLGVYSARNLSLIHLHNITGDNEQIVSQGILYDYNNDGFQDYIMITKDLTTLDYYFSVYEFIGTASRMEHFLMSNGAHQKTPNCYNGYCYLADSRNVLQKLNVNTGVWTELNLSNPLSSDNNQLQFISLGYVTEDPIKDIVVATWSDLNGWYMHVIDGSTYTELCSYPISNYNYIDHPVLIGNLAPFGYIGVGTEVYLWHYSYERYTHSGNPAFRFKLGAVTFFNDTCAAQVLLEQSYCRWNSDPGWSYLSPFYLLDLDDTASPGWNGQEYEVCFYMVRDCSCDVTSCTGNDFGGGTRFVCYTQDFFNFKEIFSSISLGADITLADVDPTSFGSEPADVYEFLGEGTRSLGGGGWTLTVSPRGKVVAYNGSEIDNFGNYEAFKIPFQQSDYADFVWYDNQFLYLYTDDFNGNITNNLPDITSVYAYPNPGFTDHNISWYIDIVDAESNLVYSAFDCEDDGVMEYPLTVVSGGFIQFNCTYASSGLFTGRAYVTDNINFNISNATDTSTVTIDPTPPTELGCFGFTELTCTGSCYFYDQFNYNYTIYCSGWSGSDRIPENDKLHIENIEAGEEIYLDKRATPIESWEYTGFNFQFKFKQNDSKRTYFRIYDKDVAKTLVTLYWENGKVYHFDYLSPYITELGNYNLTTEYLIRGDVNFETQRVTFNYLGNTKTTEFSDSEVTSAGYFVFDWLYDAEVDWYIDDFLISYGAGVVGAEDPGDDDAVTVSYLDTGHFCAIDYDTRSFVESDCALRGYDTREGLEGLCIIRSCISDVFSYVYATARVNIVMTIIVILSIILLAPLLVMAGKKFR